MDTFSIYQLPAHHNACFVPLHRAVHHGFKPCISKYELKYENAPLNGMSLEDIFEMFNENKPSDFTGRSLSISDVIVLVKAGCKIAYYVDAGGFRHIPNFFEGEGPMSMFRRGYQQALKDISTPVSPITEKWEHSICPRCKKSFADYEDNNDGYVIRANLERCPFCGQKLYWDGTEGV